MAVTDLTGYTWIGKTDISGLSYRTYSINFTSNNRYFNEIEYDAYVDDADSVRIYEINNPSIFVYNNKGHLIEPSLNEWLFTGGADVTNATLITWLEANGTLQQPEPTVVRKSVDLTTLAGWEALSSGTHNITIVAKANGFKDSAPSAAVQVEKVVNWTINITATNCTADASNPTVVPSNTTAENPVILKFNKATGYTLPASVVLDGIADDGYTWSVSSDGTVGTITIVAPTGNITGTITGVATTTTIDGGTYKWLDNASLTEWTQEINFTSNGASYSGMRYTGNGTAMTLQYMNADSEWQTVYNYDEDASTGSWVNTAWQIVDLGTSAQTVTALFKAEFIANTTHLTVCSEYTIVSENTIIRG